MVITQLIIGSLGEFGMIIKIFVTKEPNDKLFISKEHAREIIRPDFDEITMPILWCRDGLFRFIPKEVIQNVYELRKSILEAKNLKRLQPPIVIMWSQGIPISNQTGRALVGE